MHHFGCVAPSYEALELIRQVARGRLVLDIGSGNGYWTFLLRRQAVEVIAVDSGQSRYRTQWIGDTVTADGVKWLMDKRAGQGQGDVLLLVYPIVGGDGFTERVIRAYKGDTVCVVGTQCRNGYTAFRDKLIDEWMAEEVSKDGEREWEKIVQIPVPAFAGKDEALFIFQRREKARES